MSEVNSVVETAVERTSWGKSRNELLCRFHNSGGLHRISGDAPLETRILTHEENHVNSRIIDIPGVVNKLQLDGRSTSGIKINGANTDVADPPPYCHIFKANSPSSKRTCIAAIAYHKEACKLVKRNTKNRRVKNANKKNFKRKYFLKNVKLPSSLASNKNINFLTIEEIKERIVVCDGGNTDNDGMQPLEKDIYCLKIRNGDLWVADTLNASTGLHYISTSESYSTFIRLPRNESLQILSDSRPLCNAMRICALTQRVSLSRGKQRHVYLNGTNKYCCVGAQPGRNVKGVLSGLYRIEQGFPSEHWDILHNTLRQAEHAFDKYVNTDVIRHITCAKSRINFATMVPSPSSSDNTKVSRYYNGVSFGVNVHLRAHTDKDFTMSIVQAHIERQEYKNCDAVICYFAFPRIGIAVALRPGDFLLFNPQEPHCISSRCQNGDEIFSLSSYLKTAIVGLNDNSNTTI